MDASDKPLPDLAGLLKTWIPWRSEPANVPREFWMPDQSCMVCYECDSQFTLFNRRHHCRLCGRVFCASCTSNWVPAPPSERKTSKEDWEKLKACNYCFKQWEQGLTCTVDNGYRAFSLDLSTSPSTSFLSSKSSDTTNSSSITVVSMPQSDSSYHQSSPCPSSVTDTTVDKQVVASGRNNDTIPEMRSQPPKPCGFYTNRSDEDDYDYRVYPLDSHSTLVNGYYDQVPFYEIHDDYGSHKVHPDRETMETKSMGSSSLHNSLDSQGSVVIQQIAKKEYESDLGDECEAPSSLCAAEDVDLEPVDFENNGLLWLPPEPEDEEDEREALLFEDDDDGDATGEWSYLHGLSRFGSGESRNKDRSNEEHKKAMKNVVDGHFRALVAQLMLVENLPVGEEDDKESWLEIVTYLSWEAATLLKPDMSTGGGMDPGGYVKVKCIASGHRCDSMVVKGVVCKKNVAHRRMKSRMEKPRLLILGGTLEYQRVSIHLSSFATLLQQEMDHLKMAVAKIDAHHPDVLLVEKSVSRYAQEYLLAKGISLVLNIKRPLLDRIARCTGSQIVPSIDHLSPQKLGHCGLFHVEKVTEEHGTAGHGGKISAKTLMYFEGCPKPLGCTILLRGANEDELKKVKHVIQYGIFAAYHLALETSFLADEGASLPDIPLNSPVTVAIPDKSANIDRSISMIPGFTSPANEKSQGLQPCGEPQRTISIPTSNLASVTSGASDHRKETTLLPSLSDATATSLSSLASSQQGVPDSYSNEPLKYYASAGKSSLGSKESSDIKISPVNDSQDFMGGHFSTNTKQLEAIGDIVQNNLQNDSTAIIANKLTSDMSSLQLDVKNMHESSVSSKEEFPPSPLDHQSILVSLSSRCVWKGTVCERSHLFRIKYYGNFDKPLGCFLRDHLFDKSYRCRSCEMPSEAHVHCYTHRQGTLTISVKKLPEIFLPGEKEGKIWRWHRCLKCPRANGFPPATQRVVMSDAAWGLSFGKFLELSFSNHAAASRVASCGHSLHRDCLRFYGFGKMVACFRYASIDVLSVYLPPHKLNFNFENQEWIRKELNEVAESAELLFSEVLKGLGQMVRKRYTEELLNNGLKTGESSHQISELEGVLLNEKIEFEESVQKILNNEAKKRLPFIDIIEVNRLRRQLLFQSYMWDNRLVYAASLEKRSSILSNLSGSKSADMKKPVAAYDKLIDVRTPVKTGVVSSNCDSILVDTKLNKSNGQGKETGSHNQPELIHHKIDDDIDSTSGKDTQHNSSTGANICDKSDPLESNVGVHRALSDGEVPIMTSLSETLDAVWTGKMHLGILLPRDNTSALSELAVVDTSIAVAVAEKSDLAEHRDDKNEAKIFHSPVLSTGNSDHMDDSVSWLGMPFLNFYRSLNKNFLSSVQKLDTLGEYNPVYVSSFRESELQGGARLLLPVGVHDTVIPVYDDEPTSMIAYALVSSDYSAQLSDEIEKPKDGWESTLRMQSLDSANFQSFNSFDEMTMDFTRSLSSSDESILSMSGSHASLGLDSLPCTKALHARVSFGYDGPPLGKIKYTVTCYYAKQFEALRKICCPSEMDFIRSLSRCKKWGAQGGKSNVFFAKTLDDRFIIKQVTKTELESFIKFAPNYFKYLSDSIGTRSPTCLAKIFGIFQIKYLKGGKESKMDLLVMENLLFGRSVTRLYDLKGSSRSRYNPDSSGSNKVLLDQNLIEAMPTSPIFVGNKAKRLLERAVWNDTSFLDSIDVMDYSLLVGVDGEKHELVLGIIDFMRQYTWDKHLETWVKASGILGGPKNVSPTVISPKQYKKRFRKAMTTYFLMIPDQWSPPRVIPNKSQAEACEENAQGGTQIE